MVLYTCSKCLFSTSDKSKYTRHENRKYPCSIKLPVSQSPTEIENKSIVKKKEEDHSKTFQIIPKKSNSSPKTYRCEYCTNYYSSGYNLNKHLKICKTKQKHEMYLNSEFNRLKCQLFEEKKRVEQLENIHIKTLIENGYKFK